MDYSRGFACWKPEKSESAGRFSLTMPSHIVNKTLSLMTKTALLFLAGMVVLPGLGPSHVREALAHSEADSSEILSVSHNKPAALNATLCTSGEKQ